MIIVLLSLKFPLLNKKLIISYLNIKINIDIGTETIIVKFILFKISFFKVILSSFATNFDTLGKNTTNNEEIKIPEIAKFNLLE